MKTIGMIGGLSWESTAVYYRVINREVLRRLSGSHSAKILLYSFDFEEILALQDAGRWREADDRMATAAVTLEKAGADFLVICCNTMHCAAPAIESSVRIPLLHIADPLGEAIRKGGYARPALLGSRHTMQREDILRGRLKGRFGLDVLAPQGSDVETIDRPTCDEFVRGIFSDETRKSYAGVIARLVHAGADSVIMGCTEIPLLLRAEDSSAPLFDTTTLHALSAVEMALG